MRFLIHLATETYFVATSWRTPEYTTTQGLLVLAHKEGILVFEELMVSPMPQTPVTALQLDTPLPGEDIPITGTTLMCKLNYPLCAVLT